ncbi:MAG TPA: ABC transporter ATP-binding protein [Actinomycetota bacterium]|nr:ABC transporter ATP-binding protein [Actinomycetota bacterium]
MSAALVATGLSKRYRRHWGLRECTLEIPQGRVAALVGPNGAGKTTLLHLATGLLRPTSGVVSVLGRTPDDPEVLHEIGFVAQDAPLYRSFSVRDLLEFGRRTNARWDVDLATDRIERLGLDPGQRAGTLSGGQRAQVALTLALAKRPRVLLLDEPLASLDPLARREFLQSLMESVADSDLSVVLSSHLITDLERVCDYLVVLSSARTQVAGVIDDLLATHRVLVGPGRDVERIAGVAEIVRTSRTERQTTILARVDGPIADPSWSADPVDLEELVLAYLGAPDASALPPPSLARARAEVSR